MATSTPISRTSLHAVGDILGPLGVDAECPAARQRFAAQLEQDAVVFQLFSMLASYPRLEKKANLTVGLSDIMSSVLSPSSQRAKRRMTMFSPMAAMFWLQQLLRW